MDENLPANTDDMSSYLVPEDPTCQGASFNFMAAITVHSDFGAQENKICHCFHFSPSICHEVMGLDAMILVFLMLSFKPSFFTLSPSSRGSLVPLHFLPFEWYHLYI